MSTEFSTELSGYLPGPQFSPKRERTINLMRLITLRAPLMIAVALVLALPSLAVVWFRVPEEYQATTEIRFAATPITVMSETGQGRVGNYATWVNTQVSLLSGPTILAKVLDDPQVRALPAVRNADNPIAYLSSIVTARVQRGSELVSVVCTAPDKDTATTVLRATIEKYMEYAHSTELNTNDVRRNLLIQERDQLQKELDGQRDRIKTLKRAIGVPLHSTAELGPSETESYRQNHAKAQADLITAEYALQTLQNSQARVKEFEAQFAASPGDPIFAFDIETRVLSSTEVAMLRQQVATAVTEYEMMRSRYVAGNPKLSALEETRKSLEAGLVRAEREAREKALRSVAADFAEKIAMAEKNVEDARERLAEFDSRLTDHAERSMQVAQNKAEIDEMELRATDIQLKLRKIADQIYEIEVEGKAPGRVSQPSTVIVPARANYGTRLKFMLMALIASVAAGGGVGLWREITDKQVRTPQDLAELTSLPVLAMVPHASVDKHSGQPGASPLLSADHPGSTTADQFRRILTRIIYPPEGSAELNTCLITSPSQGDGKSSMACNLATALAQADRRVLLVDINARRPVIEDSFGLEAGPGLSEVLFGECEPNDVVRATSFNNLYVIGPGFGGDALIGKLASREMVEFLEQAEQAFEHVIIDTPPALLMSDAKLLAPVVDGVVLVVGVQVSSTGMIQRCLNDMAQIGANVIGVVLNGVRPTRGGYLRENLSQYYSYAAAGNGRRAGAPPARPLLVEPDGEVEDDEEEEPAILLVDDGSDSDEGRA